MMTKAKLRGIDLRTTGHDPISILLQFFSRHAFSGALFTAVRPMATALKTPHTPAQLRLCETYRNLGLWTFQGWVAMFFIAAGYAKLTVPIDTLTALMTWPALVDADLVRGVGLAETLLALGLLTPLISWRFGGPILMTAAAGLLALQTVMLGVHLLGQDPWLSVVNLILMALTTMILIGRRRQALPPRPETRTLLG